MNTDVFLEKCIKFWGLLFADWKREYKGENVMDRLDEGMGLWEFTASIIGFSSECRFWDAVNREPKKISTPDQIAALTGRYLGPKREGPPT